MLTTICTTMVLGVCITSQQVFTPVPVSPPIIQQVYPYSPSPAFIPPGQLKKRGR